MCAGAMVNARIARVVFGADDPKWGSCGSLYNLGADPRLNHEFEVTAGVRADECAAPAHRLLRRPPLTRCTTEPVRKVGVIAPVLRTGSVGARLSSPLGGLPERTNGAASKAVVALRVTVGSNPTPSATQIPTTGV